MGNDLGSADERGGAGANPAAGGREQPQVEAGCGGSGGALLLEAGRLFCSSLDLASVLQEVARRSTEVLAVDLTLLRLAEHGFLVVKGSFFRDPGEEAQVEGLLRENPIRCGEGIAGWVVQTGQPAVSDHPGAAACRTLPGYQDYLSRRRWLVQPIVVKGRAIGALTLISADLTRSFAARDLALARGIADQVAVAIENARLFEATERELGERRQVEAALRESQERFELAASAASDGLWDWDLVADTVDYSPRFRELIGAAGADIGSHPDAWLDRLHPHDAPGVRAQLQAHLAGVGERFETEFRIRHQDGEALQLVRQAAAGGSLAEGP